MNATATATTANATATTKAKWASSAGPRQTKAVNDALQSLRWHGLKRRELTDNYPQGAILTQMFGEVSQPVAEAIATIGERFAWNVTSDNYRAIIADCEAAIGRIEIPTDDKRTTQDERAKIEAEREEMRRMQAEREQKRAADKAAALADLKAKYPWAKQDGSGHARAAFNIKKELQNAFPGVKFSVKSSSFAGGNSVDVHWENGPTSAEVDAIISKYEQGSFNGMTDCYEYDHSGYADAVEIWLGSTKYAHSHRKVSAEYVAKIRELLIERGYTFTDEDRHGFARDHQVAYATSYPVGAVIVGLESCELSAANREGLRAVFATVANVVAKPATVTPATIATTEPTTPPDATPAASARCRVEKHFHTKRLVDFWIVVLTARLDSGEFEKFRMLCKASGGWYSAAWRTTPGGFAFESESLAIAFAKII
jgi:hypothetical protein